MLSWSRDSRGAARVGAAMAVLAAMLLPAIVARPARADAVRSAEQWVLDAMNIPAAWQLSKGSGVIVAVIDSGVDGKIPDLVGQVRLGPDLTGVHTPASSAKWGMHGTWMASLIAGHGHAGGGIVGVAPQSRILSIRVITDRQDPSYAQFEAEGQQRIQHQLAAAIRYAVRHGAGVISMSLGYAQPSLAVRSALQYAFDRGIVVVASSGNSGTDATPSAPGQAPYSFPATYPGVLGVAAVNRAGMPASFSSENLSVQIAAPGVNVPAAGRDGKYWLVSGTSPACALAAGVAALIKSRYPGLSPDQIRTAITGATRNRPPRGYDDHVGHGTVDAAAALAAAGKLANNRGAESARAPHLTPDGHYGSHAAALPAPVSGRSRSPLAGLIGLAALSLILVVASAWRLTKRRVTGLRAAPAAGQSGHQAGSGQPGGFGGAAPGPWHPPAMPSPGPGHGLARPGQAGPLPSAAPPGWPAPGLAVPVPPAAAEGWAQPGVAAQERSGYASPVDRPGESLPGSVPGHSGLGNAGEDQAGTNAGTSGEAAPDSAGRPVQQRFSWPRQRTGRHAAPRDQPGRPGDPE